MEYGVQHAEVYDVLKEAVKEGLDRILDLQAGSIYIGTYFDFPSMSRFESGLPNFSFSLLSGGPIDYRYAFGRQIPTDSMQTWPAFCELVPKYSSLRRYYGFKDDEETPLSGSKRSLAFLTIESLVDHYIHIHGRPDFNEDAFASVFIEWERCAFLDDLPFNIFIPLIYVTFEFDLCSACQRSYIQNPLQREPLE